MLVAIITQHHLKILLCYVGFPETAGGSISANAYLGAEYCWPTSPPSLSHVRGKKLRKRTTGLVWVTKRHLQEPTRRLARTFSSSTGLRRWCLHMCRQLQQCHCCCIHIHPSIASSPWMVPPPRLRSSGCIDQAKLLLGLQSRLHPNRSSRANVLSIQFCSWSRSVDAFHAAGLDASLHTGQPAGHIGYRLHLSWGVSFCPHRLSGGRNAPANCLTRGCASDLCHQEKQHQCRCGLL